jgi:hypothetical protein
MTHVWRHPKYYAELRKLSRKQQATSGKLQAPEATSGKQQAILDSEDTSHKQQAPRHKHQET